MNVEILILDINNEKKYEKNYSRCEKKTIISIQSLSYFYQNHNLLTHCRCMQCSYLTRYKLSHVKEKMD